MKKKRSPLSSAKPSKPTRTPKRKSPIEPEPQLGKRVHDLRTHREWSLEELSAASGVSRSMLSQIERDQTNPTLAVSLRIAAAFGVSLDELVGQMQLDSHIIVVRSRDSSHHYRSDQDVRIRTLSPLHLEKDVELYEIRLSPAGVLQSAPHFQGTREFLSVVRGKISIQSGDHQEALAEGDSASYRADVAHAITNLGKSEALLMLVVVYRD